MYPVFLATLVVHQAPCVLVPDRKARPETDVAYSPPLVHQEQTCLQWLLGGL